MSFKFNWKSFNDAFYTHLSQSIQKGLNSRPSPPGVCSELIIKDLYFGQQPPEVNILEIAELSLHKTRILARISYASDGYIILSTQVQANPLCGTQGTSFEDWKNAASPDIVSPQLVLAATKSLIVPIIIRITDLVLDGLLWLCWKSTSPNFSLAFVSDPLVSISVSSSFDSVPKVKQSLQTEIEGQIRDALLKTIPEAVGSFNF